MNVKSVRVSDWDKKDGSPIVKVSNVTFDDGTEAPGYDLPPGIEEGKPLPEGWSVATSNKGKPYIKVPKPGRGGGGFGGGAAAFRNTAEGQSVEQERMDRRTALMQAVILAKEIDGGLWFDHADEMYLWLRRTAGKDRPPAVSVDQVQERKPASGKDLRATAGRETQGSGTTDGEAAPGPCAHSNCIETRPDGTDAGAPLPRGFRWCLDCSTPVKGAA